MEASAYDALDAAGVEAAVAGGKLSKEEALTHEHARVQPRPEVLTALGAQAAVGAAEGTASVPGPSGGPQAPNTVPGPSTPATLSVHHGTQDEPRDYQAKAEEEVGATGTEDEPRGYRDGPSAPPPEAVTSQSASAPPQSPSQPGPAG